MIAAGPDVPIRRIVPDGWKPSGAGYAYGILAGDTLFIAGLGSNDPAGGGIVGGDIKVQAKRTLDNLGRGAEGRRDGLRGRRDQPRVSPRRP